MITINSLIEEIKNIPVNKLEEVYNYLHAITEVPSKSAGDKQNIASFAGIFNDMDPADYSDFITQTQNTRNNLFSREIKE